MYRVVFALLLAAPSALGLSPERPKVKLQAARAGQQRFILNPKPDGSYTILDTKTGNALHSEFIKLEKGEETYLKNVQLKPGDEIVAREIRAKVWESFLHRREMHAEALERVIKDREERVELWEGWIKRLSARLNGFGKEYRNVSAEANAFNAKREAENEAFRSKLQELAPQIDSSNRKIRDAALEKFEELLFE